MIIIFFIFAPGMFETRPTANADDYLPKGPLHCGFSALVPVARKARVSWDLSARGRTMRHAFLTGAGAFALALASPLAIASDLPAKSPVYTKAPVAPPFDWTGWYGGMNLGVGISQTRGTTEAIAGAVDRSDAGFAGGIQGGYNWQFDPHWVVGMEADIGHLGIDRSFADWINDSASVRREDRLVRHDPRTPRLQHGTLAALRHRRRCVREREEQR